MTSANQQQPRLQYVYVVDRRQIWRGNSGAARKFFWGSKKMESPVRSSGKAPVGVWGEASTHKPTTFRKNY